MADERLIRNTRLLPQAQLSVEDGFTSSDAEITYYHAADKATPRATSRQQEERRCARCCMP